MLPFGVPIDRTLVRVYVSSRDALNRSHITSMVVEVEPSPRIVEFDGAPLLSPGAYGTFDESGVSLGCVLELQGATEVWYHGWSLRYPNGWWNSIGMASREQGGPLVRASPAPVFDRSDEDPYSLAYPFVGQTDDERWMWYSSLDAWRPPDDARPFEFLIKHARREGEGWQRLGTAIGLTPPDSVNSRPSVLWDQDGWRMWFCAKGERYRIAYAESEDGRGWERRDDSGGLLAAGSGGEMTEVCYPHVFRAGDQLLMLYNGDGYGRTGFGIARWR